MADTDSPSGAAHPRAQAIEALRQRGADRLDPHRFHLAQALARRADIRQGASQQVLDQRITTLLQELDAVVERAPAAAVKQESPAGQPCRADVPTPGPLAGLLAHLAGQPSAPLPGLATSGAAAAPGAGPAATPRSPVDPQTLDFFRRTWSRLSAEQRLAQSRSALPGNAGPLNSQHLVHRALTTLRELSPAYFERFMTHVDALLWLERAQEQAARQVGLPPRAKAARKPAGTRRG